jgi:agmatine/peptidylarginine deiminase
MCESRRLLDGLPVSIPQEGVKLVGDELVFLEDGAVPRSITDAERLWLERNPSARESSEAVTPAPTGTLDTPAEWEQMEGLVVAWSGSTTWRNNLAQIARHVTVDAGGRIYMAVTSPTLRTQATNSLTAAGADMSRVHFFFASLDSIWARDYGPRYAFEDNVRVIADHRYNVPRPNDDNVPVVFGNFKNHQYYEMGIGTRTMVHGGGNYHLDSDGDAYATRLINDENTVWSQSQIQQVWNTYQGNNTTITRQYPFSVDGTGHIDMWMQIYGQRKVFISDWPNNPGSTQDQISEETVPLMQSRGYEVTRIPSYLIGGVHYTFTNMVIFNNIVILPQYNNGPGATVSNQVAQTVRDAFGPGYTVFQLNADSIVQAAGVFHCIVQHMPKHRGAVGPNGGLAPTAFVRGLNSPNTFASGASTTISWISDDDAPLKADGVTAVDIYLSTDGGATFPTGLATGLPALGSFTWNIPAGISTTDARIKVVARDSLGNEGFDLNDADLTIDTVAPSVVSGSFARESEQRLELQLNEPASVAGIVLTSLTTGQVLSGSQLQVVPSGSSLAVRPASGLLANGQWRVSIAGQLTDGVGNVASSSFTYDFRVLAGDADDNGTVEFADLLVLAQSYGQAGKLFSQGNFDYDALGQVTFDDLLILSQNYGNTLIRAQAPEPRQAKRGARMAEVLA